MIRLAEVAAMPKPASVRSARLPVPFSLVEIVLLCCPRASAGPAVLGSRCQNRQNRTILPFAGQRHTEEFLLRHFWQTKFWGKLIHKHYHSRN